MKTPRDILLHRHAPAGEKLDVIRKETVRLAANPNRRSASGRASTIASTALHALTIPFRELFWPARRIWAGFAVAWLVVVAVNLEDSNPAEIAASKWKPLPSGTMMAWEQEQKLFRDLIEPTEAHEARQPKSLPPKPRSERPPAHGMA